MPPPLLTKFSVLPPKPKDYENGLVGWWPFIGGSLADQSGFGSATTANSAYTPGAAAVGPTITSSAVNTVTISPCSAIATATAMSVSCWVNLSSLANAYTSVVKITAGGTVNTFAIYVKSNGLQAVYVQTGASTSVDFDGAGATIATGTPYHLCATYDSVSGINFYVNGVHFSGASANGSIYFGAGAVTLAFGYDPNTASRQINGSLADVRIYNRTLSGAEAFALFAQPVAFPIGIGEGELPVMIASYSGTANGQASVSGDAVVGTGGEADGQASVSGGAVARVSGAANGQASVNGGVILVTPGTANGQASVSGGAVVQVPGAANGQASVSGGIPAFFGTANGQASVSGGAVVQVIGAANGQASASTPTYIVVSGTANGQASASASVTSTTFGAANGQASVSGGVTGSGTYSGALTENMAVSPGGAQQWKWGRTLLQNLTVHQADARQLTYHAALTQVVELAQLFTRGFPTTLTQNMTVHQSAALAHAVFLLQNMTVQMSGGPVGNLVLTLNENITLSDTDIIKAIYAGTLSDTIAMTGLYISPSGTVTTWAINTRTNAVTEYTNYNFNSFAQVGLKYIAANSSGIYELTGDTDNGASINADIISAFMQMNGSKLSGLKAIYLAVRGGGQFFIKIINGDGREYIYEAVGQPGLMTTKVNVGKGLRARYIAFQLTSTGQDFNLDDLSFIPMLSDRRV